MSEADEINQKRPSGGDMVGLSDEQGVSELKGAVTGFCSCVHN